MLTKELLDKFFIGWDTWNAFPEQKNNYPPFNIIKTSDTEYAIEMAVSGFSKNELSVELVGDRLIVKGNAVLKQDSTSYLYRGLSKRSFTREFKIADCIEIKSGSVTDGILRIDLESVVPEELKPRKIELV